MVQFWHRLFFGSSIKECHFWPYDDGISQVHRYVYIDSKCDNKEASAMRELIEKNDWNSLVEFSWLKTCPFFWIPAHTIVFLLPSHYRVIVSAGFINSPWLVACFCKKGES